MKSLYKYILVLVAVFSLCLITVDAKTTKSNDKSTKTETKETSKKEEVKENDVKEKKKVTLYLFRRSGCPHCAEEMEFLDKIVPDYKDKLNIVVYDVSVKENQELIQAVVDELQISVQGVPFNIIGSKTQEGYAAVLDDTFRQMIETAYEEQPEDLVASVIEKNKLNDTKPTDLYEAMDEEGLEYTSKKGSKAKLENIIFIAVFSIAVIGLGSLIYFSRKK